MNLQNSSSRKSTGLMQMLAIYWLAASLLFSSAVLAQGPGTITPIAPGGTTDVNGNCDINDGCVDLTGACIQETGGSPGSFVITNPTSTSVAPIGNNLIVNWTYAVSFSFLRRTRERLFLVHFQSPN
jgi:hypothetical protein